MKRLLIAAVVTCLFAAPLPAAAADLVLRNIDISIGIGDRHHRHDRQPEVIVIRDDRHRGKGHHKGPEWREHRHWRHQPQVIVIDRERHRHRRSCDSQPVVIIADGRRW